MMGEGKLVKKEGKTTKSDMQRTKETLGNRLMG